MKTFARSIIPYIRLEAKSNVLMLLCRAFLIVPCGDEVYLRPFSQWLITINFVEWPYWLSVAQSRELCSDTLGHWRAHYIVASLNGMTSGYNTKEDIFYYKGPYWQIKFDVSKLLTWQSKTCFFFLNMLCDF